jgi:hypothetical protein
VGEIFTPDAIVYVLTTIHKLWQLQQHVGQPCSVFQTSVLMFLTIPVSYFIFHYTAIISPLNRKGTVSSRCNIKRRHISITVYIRFVMIFKTNSDCFPVGLYNGDALLTLKYYLDKPHAIKLIFLVVLH